MRVEKIELVKTNRFSQILINYLKQDDVFLEQFYDLYPSINNFEKQIRAKIFAKSIRDELFQSLTEQYEGYQLSDKAQINLQSLKKENTFTITTGHQLSIFTGPLFFHYKIITVINLCRKLSQKYPNYNFVPVFWMATEDHDFDEIAKVNIGGIDITWDTVQAGPVGKFDPTGLKAVLGKIPADVGIFQESYLNESTLSNAVRNYVDEIYGKEGLVVIDGDDKRLKTAISDLIIEDCCSNNVNRLSEASSSELEKLGYKQQVFPREINFFFLKDNFRGRIVKEDSMYKVLGSRESWTEGEFKEAIQKEPWKFSPNVLLRPLYQESILPNLAYIGGPAEIAYWLQLKSSFDHYQVPFPILVPRNFCLLIKKDVEKKLAKTGMKIQELFQNKELVIKNHVKKISKSNLTTSNEKSEVEKVWDELANRVKGLEPTLEITSLAFKAKSLKSLEVIEKKMIRAEKRRQSTAVNQIEWIYGVLFPKNNLQERYDNYLTFLPDMPNLIEDLLIHLDPLDFRFHILIQE
ncbi:MAG TPA: bacillithiol biosynthesis cysteine-adding enzyme BshC [Cyclobacteriaceae bacterium]|jgi:bacillithiol biosynthesis cysteine-adding enzyme BshC